ncbi:MAG: hydratase [Devosia sp.]
MQPDLDQLARTILQTFSTKKQLDRPTVEYPGFTLDQGYDLAHRIRDLRVARGERVVGRKIGGTNRATYHLTGATGPSWGFMYDTTVEELPDGRGRVSLGRFPLARIEPELALHIARKPEPGMSEAQLLDCVDSVCHGFEFVYSPYGDWWVKGADAASAFGMHMGYRTGPWVDISDDRAGWGEMLRNFTITLGNQAGILREGKGSNALGSPILALQAVVDEIGDHPDRTPVAVGEIVTTGTLTELMPAMPGDTWTTTISGAPLTGLRVTLD